MGRNGKGERVGLKSKQSWAGIIPQPPTPPPLHRWARARRTLRTHELDCVWDGVLVPEAVELPVGVPVPVDD